MEIARRVRGGENRSDVESELELEDPTEVGDDMIFFSKEESWEIVVTLAQHRDPVAASAGDEQEVEWCMVVPAPRKSAASIDAIGEQEAKRTRSPCPLVASPVPSPPAADVAEQAGRSEERIGTHASLRPLPARDSQLEDAPPAALVGKS